MTTLSKEDVVQLIEELGAGSNWLSGKHDVYSYNRQPKIAAMFLKAFAEQGLLELIAELRKPHNWKIGGFGNYKDVKMHQSDAPFRAASALEHFADLARADLVAENERLKATPPDQRQDLHCVVSDIAAECRELHDQLTAARTALAAAEADNERLRDVINMWVGIASNCSIESGCCHCGDSMKNHASPFICGHSPVDMADAAVMNALKKSNEAFDQPRDYSALREMIAEVYAECEQACAGLNLLNEKPSHKVVIRYCIDAIRALAEKAKKE